LIHVVSPAAGHTSTVVPPPGCDPLSSDDSDTEARSDRRWTRAKTEATSMLARAREADPQRAHFTTIEKFFFQFAVASNPNSAPALLNMALVCQHLQRNLFLANRFYIRSLEIDPCNAVRGVLAVAAAARGSSLPASVCVRFCCS
jgi:hypothetical protein